MTWTSFDQRDRALGAMYGLALGDALGMPTQSMRPEHIREDYGIITDFVDAGPRQLIAKGMPAGSITDDTEQAIMLADLIIAGDGAVDPARFAQALIAWERDMMARGSLDLLGPSTKRAVQLILDGADPDDAGRFGTTNGAAMRITPAAIAMPIRADRDLFVDYVSDTCSVTHNTTIGIAAAAALAGAVSAGIDGASLENAIREGVAAAAIGARHGHWVAGGDIATRISWAVQLVADTPREDLSTTVSTLIGTSVASQESVVAAFALAAAPDDSWQVLCEAATIGGDTDTIAAMAGALRGSVQGMSTWPPAAVETVRGVNSLHLEPLVDSLLVLRNKSANSNTGDPR